MLDARSDTTTSTATTSTIDWFSPSLPKDMIALSYKKGLFNEMAKSQSYIPRQVPSSPLHIKGSPMSPTLSHKSSLATMMPPDGPLTMPPPHPSLPLSPFMAQQGGTPHNMPHCML